MNFVELIEKLKPIDKPLPVNKCYKCLQFFDTTIELCLNQFNPKFNIVIDREVLTKTIAVDVVLCEKCFIKLFGDSI